MANPAQKLKTSPVVRGSFVHLAKPRQIMGQGTPKFSLVLMLDQENQAHVDYLAHVKEVAKEVAKELCGGKIPKKFVWPWKDGDEEGRPEYEGHVVINASTPEDYPPTIVDRDLEPVIDPAQLYSGAHYRVSGRIFGWDFNGKKGVSFGLQNVQFWADGDRFSGAGSDPAEDFSEKDVWGE